MCVRIASDSVWCMTTKFVLARDLSTIETKPDQYSDDRQSLSVFDPKEADGNVEGFADDGNQSVDSEEGNADADADVEDDATKFPEKAEADGNVEGFADDGNVAIGSAAPVEIDGAQLEVGIRP